MTAHGIIDMRFGWWNNADGQSVTTLYDNNLQDLYISICKFLTSSYGQLAGAVRVAYNTGSAALGTGTDYADQSNAVGTNPWSVWQFVSGSMPWYMLMGFGSNNDGSTGGQAPNYVNGNNFQVNGLFFQFAIRSDGGSPWNGTTRNDGSDVKNSSTVWAPSGSHLYVWPRSNGPGGTFEFIRQNCMLATAATNPMAIGSRAHFICNENNFLLAIDSDGNGSYRVCYFGKYTARTGSNPECPYVAFFQGTEGADPAITNNSVTGDTAGTAGSQGGIAHPWMPVSGVKGVIFSGLNELWTSNLCYNTIMPNPQFDETPILCGINEYPQASYAGQLDFGFIRYIYGVNSMDTSPDLRRIVFGNNTPNSTKVSVPWDGATTPGTNNSRSGVMF